MTVPADLDPLIRGGRTLRPTASGMLSALAEEDVGAPYDRLAGIYDRLIGSPTYNRVLWRTRVADYTAFAAEALAAGNGPFLDAGCGTAVFTAPAYQASDRAVVLVDRSLGMLAVAARRVGRGSATVLQADLLDLPFAPGRFGTIGCYAMLHVLDDPWAVLAALHAQLAPGGTLFASMLVTDRRGLAGPYLRMLRRRGELGPLRDAAGFATAARTLFGDRVSVRREGSMAYLRATRAAAG